MNTSSVAESAAVPKSSASETAPSGKERPVLFSAPMIRALLAGTKTQTRRIVKPQPFAGDRPAVTMWNTSKHHATSNKDAWLAACPYGVPGDTLWVREEFSGSYAYQGYPPREWLPGSPIWWWADGEPTEGDWCKPKPSIHMPRWASRITLKITDVRVERLNDISEADALAEGAQEPSLVPIIHACWSERDAYAKLWNHINGPRSWDANPWVWAVSFEVAN